MSKTDFSDTEFVYGVFCKDMSMQKALYLHCRRYFFAHYSALFFAPQSDAEDIFQDSFIALWQNIEHRKIYVEKDIIIGKDGLPFKGTLTSYLMGIAKLKYMELVRTNSPFVMESALNDNDAIATISSEPIVDEWIDEKTIMQEVISECVSKLSDRCSQILRLFYFEQRTLDEMMLILSTFHSKDALKTAKNKCLTKLRNSAYELLKIRRQ